MNDTQRKIKVLCIYGNPKHGGFVHGCLDHIATYLGSKNHEVDRLHLTESNFADCIGCFNCLRTGKCSLHDDMGDIIERIRCCDALVIGASVRNGLFPALYKRFYERITYIMGFGRELQGKYVLGIGAVGIAGGRRELGKMVTLSEFHTYVSDYLFFRTGIPTRIKVEDVVPDLDDAADKLYSAVIADKPLSFSASIVKSVDDFIIRKFMLEKNPDHVYDNVIKKWQDKGMLDN